MKLNLLPVLLLFLATTAFSQFQSSIDFIGSIDYSYRALSTSTTILGINNTFENRERTETGKLNWRVGFNYNKKIAERLYLKSGVRLASVGFKGEKKDIRWASQHDGMGGFIPDPTVASEIQFIPDFLFLELPLVGRFEFANKKITPFVELGFSPTIYLKTRTEIITDLSEELISSKEDSFNNLHLVGSLSAGINYNLTEQLQLFGQPIFRYHFTKSENTPIEERLFSVGLEMGIRKKIN